MKMEPGRPAFPAGGPCPDAEPGGPDRPGAALAPRPEPGPPGAAACADAGADLSAGRAPGPDARPESAWAPAPGPGTSYLLPARAACAGPGPDRQLPELGPLLSWTEEPADFGAPVRPESPSLRVQSSRHSRHVRGEVDFFPGFPSPAVGELTLDVSPGQPDRPSDFSHTCPLPSEPATCPEDGPRLRAVFDALDGDGDGFVRIEDFVQFATVYGAEQVKDLTKYLDPSGLGVISFEDFCRGITAIRNGESDGQLCAVTPAQDQEPPACPDEFDDFVTFEANEVTDSAYMGSESTYSECETFTDEDTSTLVHPELQAEGDADSPGGSAVPSECLDALEDPGHGALLLLPGSPAKRLSSRKVARNLHQSAALTMDTLQDPAPDPVECMEEDIADKVVFLEKRVSELEKDTAANGEQHSRLRQENLQLVHRANALEEQLKEQELRACEVALEEARRHRELVCKMERERSIEVESLQARLQQLDEENGELRSCTPCLKANIERLEEEKQKLLDEIEELSLRLSDEQENRRKLGDRLSHERHQFQRDKEATQELIEDLRKQLEHLQLFKLEAEQRRGRGSSVGLQEYNSRTRESELEQEVRRLKQDNRTLKEQNDELNGQIINLSIQGAKNLFSTSFSESLAAEISSVSRDELMDAIQKQEEINFRLQDYIDRIIVAIMETNPSILEVK
ncbi:rab11 family-interacting protein 3 isoform X4 [Mustela lutreola]|uniref:rab11 family-interacting protein 3 isoform X4 n=1 Tax=Mustela lutreola TaxID=9666 RepID=UPI002797493B|nr:rab11 family-interacting protein 3 isoform X4 [Mustela lutreola]